MKSINGFENYSITKNGNILNTKTNRILKYVIDSSGYYQVNLYNKGKSKKFLIHRLVAIYFIPNLENKPQVNHINGIKTDNRIENLEWNTSKENINHALKLSNNQRKNSKIVIDLYTGIFYNSIGDAAKTLDIKYQTLLSKVKTNKYRIIFA